MAKLSEEVQVFIVQAHACHRKASLIAKDVEAEFGIHLERDQIQFYHPHKGAKGKRLAQKWRDLFTETRKAFTARQVEIGIAQQSYRLGIYQRGADYYEKIGNYVLASEMAERAAKDLGGAYTNARVLSGPKGGAIPISLPDEKREIAARALKKLMDKGETYEEARRDLIALGIDERDIPTLQGS